MVEEHHPLRHRRRLWILVLLCWQTGRDAERGDERCFAEEYDVLIREHQFRQSGRRAHQYAPAGSKHRAAPRGARG